MCGIAGYQGPFSVELLERMNRAIAHRGPDDHGLWTSPDHQTGLAQRRLSIIDLSPSGHQPMNDSNGLATIVFNGEIYNYRELQRELAANGAIFRGGSDTEVLLNLYLRHGPDCLEKLNGIFAFALYDHGNNTLFLARDGLGVKPLYYAETSSGFLFASELKAILNAGEVSREIDLAAVHQYLSYLWCPAPRTMLRAVKKFRPGQAMIVQRGRVTRKWTFYRLPCHQTPASVSVGEAADLVHDAVRQAVRRQMVADVPVGAFLSGGLDSSAVVAMARRETGSNRLQCFSIGFRNSTMKAEGFVDDLPYARQVARHLDVDLHVVEVGPEMAGNLTRMIYHLDEPQADLAALNVLFIAELARRHDIKVLLSGAGGDDIFTGYRRHHALIRERFWTWLPDGILTKLAGLARSVPAGTPWGRRLNKAFQFADLPADERLTGYFRWIRPDLQYSLYDPAVREHFRQEPPNDPLVESLASLPPDTPPLNRMLHLEARHFLADHNLNYTDKMAMAVGVEVRVPLLDPDLVALAARLPLEYKQRGRTGKWIFKKAMETDLPASVVYRPKTGFPSPVRSWLRRELAPLAEETLNPTALTRRGLFNPEAVKNLEARERAGRLDGAYTLLGLICIEIWCRVFIDGQEAS